MERGAIRYWRLVFFVVIFASSGEVRAEWTEPLESYQEFGLGSENGDGQGQAEIAGMLDFLPAVLEMARNPPPESHLDILCQVHLAPENAPEQGYATVLRLGGNKKAFIIAWSPHKLERPWATITLRGVFVRTGESHPTDEGTMDWAYVFDRNQDGKIDFFSYLVGPLWIPAEADRNRKDLPSVKGGVQLEFFEKMRDRVRNGFWHMADDNFDGHHDGVIARLTDDGSGWADGWVIARDADFDKEYESCSWMEGDISTSPQPCAQTEDGYQVPGKTFAGLLALPPPAGSQLKALNQIVDACRFDAKNLYSSPVSGSGAAVEEGTEAAAGSAGAHPCYENLDYEICHSMAVEGDAQAQERLGYMYANGKGVAEDHEEAVRWFRKSVEQGYRVAEYNLGYMYYFGKGVAQDRAEAVRWYRRAAEQDYPLAQLILGFLHFKGEDVRKDDEEAARWIRKAAENGHIEAQFRLGAAYAIGRGVDKDYVEAYAWWAVAYANGSVQAREGIAKISQIMSRKQVAEAKALAIEIYARVYPESVGAAGHGASDAAVSDKRLADRTTLPAVEQPAPDLTRVKERNENTGWGRP